MNLFLVDQFYPGPESSAMSGITGMHPIFLLPIFIRELTDSFVSDLFKPF